MDIVAMGEPLLEFSEITDSEGRKVYLPGFGGDTSNFIIAAARQKAKTSYFTHVGADAFGEQFLKLWQMEGVDISRVVQNQNAHTGIYFITYTEKGHQFTYMRKGSAASMVSAEDLPDDLIAGAKLFHVSGISQAISETSCDAVFHAINIAKKNNTLVSYDPNLRLKLWGLDRAKAIINATAAMSDIFLPSLDDVVQISGYSEPDDIVDYYHSLGAKIVLLKLGPNGVLVSDGFEKNRIPGIKVDTVDQAGAGDTFDGAFCVQYLEGKTILEAATYANAAAALSTTGYGAVLPIPRREQVELFLKENERE
jgi:2-dehydro-3-deoxygluconokinase